MIFTKEQIEEMHKLAKPLIEHLNKGELFHPHVKIEVTSVGLSFQEQSFSIKDHEFIKD